MRFAFVQKANSDWKETIKDLRLRELQNDREHDISGTYERLMELMVKLAEYVGANNSAFHERMEKVMGGQVLELETDKAWMAGEQEGMQKGSDRINMLIQRLNEDNRIEDLVRSTYDLDFQGKLLKEYNL